MKSNFSKLGDYITESKLKNDNSTETNLVGLSNEKKFTDSKANIIGTDLSKYKLIKYDQFVYMPTTSRNGDKISVALFKEKSGMISSSYIVFHVNSELLNPDYLMLWFERPEFDRYARYHSHGSVREIFSWEDMQNTELFVPPLENQKKIVKIKNILDTRISILNSINKTLFSMGQIVFDEYILNKYDKEELSNWQIVPFSKLSSVQNGFAFKSEDYCEHGCAMIRTKDITSSGFVSNDSLINLPQSFFDSGKYDNYKFERLDTITVMVGASIGKMGLITDINIPSLQNQNMWRFRPKSPDIAPAFVYYYVKKINKEIINMATGSARSFYRKNLFLDYECILPDFNYMSKLNPIFNELFDAISANVIEINKLNKLKEFLLPKLMSGELDVSKINYD